MTKINVRELFRDRRVYLIAGAIRGPDCPSQGSLSVLAMCIKAVITARIRGFLGADHKNAIRTTRVSEAHCERLLDRAREYIEEMTEEGPTKWQYWLEHYLEHLHDGLTVLPSLMEPEMTEEEEEEIMLMTNTVKEIIEICELGGVV